VKYTKHFNPQSTPQTEAIPFSGQVSNSGGGFSWEVDNWTKLGRFLILGTEGGSYYAGEREMTLKSCDAAVKCLAEDGLRVVRTVVEISESGRAPKNDPSIFVLAMAAGKGDAATKKVALEALPKVCRIGTHLFQFLEAVQAFRGWGRGLRRAVANWYTEKDVDALAYQVVKYRQRNGWSHRDALRLAHPSGFLGDPARHQVCLFALGKALSEEVSIPGVIEAFQSLEKAESDKDVVGVINSNRALSWEMVPSQFLKSRVVWEALLPNMKMTATIRNLGRLTSLGMLGPMSESEKLIRERITDDDALKKERVHPISALIALLTYKAGHGQKGSLTWTPNQRIVDALDETFYAAFGNVKPSGKHTVIALDVSGSMSGGSCAGVEGLSPRVASSAMAMVTARTEKDYAIMAFSSGFIPLNITPRQRLDSICAHTESLPFDTTNCAMPMLWATKHKIPAETFVVYTDSETNYGGSIHAAQALRDFRQKMGIPAKLVVCGMVANDFTIADPKDGGMMDVIGFDTATPNLISDFSAGV
jgi:60 kDa SS-A/Ro ribonucleoprotein